MKNIIITFLTFYSIASVGQDLKKAEQDLIYHLKKINYWGSYNGDNEKIHSIDSLQKENNIFEKKLEDYTSRLPLTLTYDFNELKKESITIVSSSDKKFRIYSWDTQEGGTMHYFRNVYQYQFGTRIISKRTKTREGDSGGWYSEIFTLNKNSKNVYLGYFNAIYSTKDAYQGVRSFNIESNSLNDRYLLIKTTTGLKNELGFGFDFFSVAERKERPVKLIYFDSTNKTIKIPVVSDKGVVTNKFIVYRFRGSYFEREK